MRDRLGFGLIGNQTPVGNVIANRWDAAHPHPLALAGGNLVPDALASHLALKLGKGQQHVEHQSAHGRGRVELLGDRHKGHALSLKDFDHLGEVSQAAG